MIYLTTFFFLALSTTSNVIVCLAFPEHTTVAFVSQIDCSEILNFTKLKAYKGSVIFLVGQSWRILSWMLEHSFFFVTTFPEFPDGVSGINCEDRKFSRKCPSMTMQVKTWFNAHQTDTIFHSMAIPQRSADLRFATAILQLK